MNLHSARRVSRDRCGVAAAFVVAFAARPVRAEPYRLRADAFAESPDASGFIALSGEARERGDYRYDAEALVWTGLQADRSADPEARGEAVIASVRVTAPERWADLTFGRQLYQGGAIRPLHFDGAKAAVRSDEGGELEVFGGLPVQTQFRGRSYDWVAGYRFTHRAEDIGRFGFSYLQQRDLGRRAREELGVEGAFVPSDIFAATATSSLDVLRGGLAEARVSGTFYRGLDRLEIYAVRRSPDRMLPATSLFSALGSYDVNAAGVAGSWRAAPRLDLYATATVDGVAQKPGATQLLRAELRLDDAGSSAIGLEGRRASMPGASWTGARAFGRAPVAGPVSASAEVEVVLPDAPSDRGSVWPWSLVAVRYAPTAALEAAAGLEASASPENESSIGGLVRISGAWGAP